MNTNRTPDRRVRKTRDALLSAFRDLVLENGFDAVTVLDVIDRADVGRSTFYEHFENKEDLLRVSFEPILQFLADALEPNGAPGLAGVLEHFWERRQFARKMFRGAAPVSTERHSIGSGYYRLRSRPHTSRAARWRCSNDGCPPTSRATYPRSPQR